MHFKPCYLTMLLNHASQPCSLNMLLKHAPYHASYQPTYKCHFICISSILSGSYDNMVYLWDMQGIKRIKKAAAFFSILYEHCVAVLSQSELGNCIVCMAKITRFL
jgi:hypothetical protein